MPRRYGAIVVGAGPAGLALAARLGRLMDVALVERRSVGWAKPCGGLLCDEAYRELGLLGLREGFFEEPERLELEVFIGERALPPQSFRNVDRAALGRCLRAVLPPSVSLFEECSCLLGRKDGLFSAALAQGTEIEAPRLVAADGVGSAARRFLGLPSVTSISLVQMRFRAGSSEACMILDPELCGDYYSWIVPRSGWTIVGMKNEGGVVARTLAELRRRFPGRFEGDPESMERYAISKPEDAAEIAATGGGGFLVGEAAGLIRPSSGEGLSWAFSSARLLAAAIESSGGADGSIGAELEAYRGAMREPIEEIGRDIALGMPFKNRPTSPAPSP